MHESLSLFGSVAGRYKASLSRDNQIASRHVKSDLCWTHPWSNQPLELQTLHLYWRSGGVDLWFTYRTQGVQCLSDPSQGNTQLELQLQGFSQQIHVHTISNVHILIWFHMLVSFSFYMHFHQVLGGLASSLRLGAYQPGESRSQHHKATNLLKQPRNQETSKRTCQQTLKSWILQSKLESVRKC